jgi:hypothetical protein
LLGSLGVPHVADEEADARSQRIDRNDVDAGDASARSDAVEGDLTPATGPRAEIDDAVALPKEPMALVELDELVGAARAKTLGLGAAVVRVLALVRHGERRSPCASRLLVLVGLIRFVVAEGRLVRRVSEHPLELRLRDHEVDRAEDEPLGRIARWD